MKKLKELGKKPPEGVSTAILKECSSCGVKAIILPAYKYGIYD